MTEAARRLFDDRVRESGGTAECALAEVIQYITLLGLSRTDFFATAAFYGGTALRMLHGLDRFSEDLDFSLDSRRPDFSVERYLPAVASELEAYGFEADVSRRQKNVQTPIESAFVKANTRAHLLMVRAPESLGALPVASQLTRVKFEVDTDPPDGATFSAKYLTTPIPFSVRTYDDSSLFAGKLAAVLVRAWKNRVKGRDWYDFSFFVARRIPVSLMHLEARLRQGDYLQSAGALSLPLLKELLHERIEGLNIGGARRDVAPFVTDPRNLEVWSRDFFHQMTDRLVASAS